MRSRFLKYLIALIISCVFLKGYSQDSTYTDSLINVLKTVQEDSLKLKTLINISNHYWNTDPDRAIEFGQKVLILAEKMDKKQAMVNILTSFGNYYLRSDHQKSIDFHKQALLINQGLENKQGITLNLRDIATANYYSGNYEGVVSYSMQALKIDEELGNNDGIGQSLFHLGEVNRLKGNFEKAVKFFDRSMEVYQEIDNKNGIALVLNGMGDVHRLQGQLKEAREYFLQSLAIREKLGEKYYIASSLGNLGVVSYYSGDHQKFLDYTNRALKLQEEIGNQHMVSMLLNNIAEYYTEQGNNKTAIEYIKRSLQIAKEIGAKERKKHAYYNLARVYYNQKNYEKALEFHQLYSQTKDTIFNENSEKQIAEMETKYETDKKEKEIKLLKNEKEIQDLEIARQEAEFNRQKVLRNSIIGGLLLLLVIVYLLYNRYVAKQKARLLQKEKDEMLAKQQLLDQRNTHQKELLDSIVKTQEDERKRIAAELHDGLGNILATAKLNLDGLQKEAQDLDQEKQTLYKNSVSLLDNACKDVRIISHNMMPGALVKLGLIPALRDFLDKLKQSGKFKIDFSDYGLEERLDETIEIVLYRIIQEIFNNIIKHAEAKEVSVQIFRHEKTLNLMVEDDGKGFDIEKVKGQNGLGVNNIESRVEFLKGKIEYDSKSGQGTNIIIEIPVS